MSREKNFRRYNCAQNENQDGEDEEVNSLPANCVLRDFPGFVVIRTGAPVLSDRLALYVTYFRQNPQDFIAGLHIVPPGSANPVS